MDTKLPVQKQELNLITNLKMCLRIFLRLGDYILNNNYWTGAGTGEVFSFFVFMYSLGVEPLNNLNALLKFYHCSNYPNAL